MCEVIAEIQEEKLERLGDGVGVVVVMMMGWWWWL